MNTQPDTTHDRRSSWRVWLLWIGCSCILFGGIVLVVSWLALVIWSRSQGYDRWVTREEADERSQGLRVPDDFPKVIPIYPGSRLVRNRLMRQFSRNRIELVFVSADSVPFVYAFYRRFFDSNGFGLGLLPGSTYIDDGREVAAVASAQRRIPRNIRVSIWRDRAEALSIITIDTLDVVSCGRGERCYNYPGVTRY